MVEPKKVIFEVGLHSGKCQRRAMKAIAKIKGIDSIEVDVNDNKMIVVGVFDPIRGHKKLKKVCETRIILVEIIKPEEPKKEEEKKEEPKKEEEKKEEEKKDQNEHYKMCPNQHTYNPCYMPQGFYVAVEENPQCCIIF